MDKIKWKYDKTYCKWVLEKKDFPFETVYHISKNDEGSWTIYNFRMNGTIVIGRLKKLSSAKKVAELLING